MSRSVLYPTLYTPATTTAEKLWHLASGIEPCVRRMVICTEDSVKPDDVPRAIENLRLVLSGIAECPEVDVFIRVRTPEVMSRILELPHIGKIAGFVVPKASPDEFPLYADQVVDHEPAFRLMVILESWRMPDWQFRSELLEVLSLARYRDLIDCVRIGANDLLGYQGIRRDDYEYTIYDTVIRTTIDNIVNEFRGLGGFTVTAPVFECFAPKYDDLFRREVRGHVLNGLFGQTVIHPRHLSMLFDMYRVRACDFESAQGIVGSDDAVVGSNGKMDERSTHLKWAQTILARHKLFGLS